MLRSFPIGLVAGGRAMTPLAALGNAARKGELPPGGQAPAWLPGALDSDQGGKAGQAFHFRRR